MNRWVMSSISDRTGVFFIICICVLVDVLFVKGCLQQTLKFSFLLQEHTAIFPVFDVSYCRLHVHLYFYCTVKVT